MAPKGSPLLLMFVLVHAAFTVHPSMKPGLKLNFSNHPAYLKAMARKLMMKCMQMGYQVPVIQNMSSHLSDIDWTGEDRSFTAEGNLFPSFLSILSSLSPGTQDTNRDPFSHVPLEENFDEKMWNCTNLPAMVKMMRNSSKAHACFTRGFLAPLSWNALVGNTGHMNSEDYDSMMWAAKPLLEIMPPTKMNLPAIIRPPHMEKMMQMLKDVFGSLAENQRTQIKDWVKEQAAQNFFNCTLRSKTSRARPGSSVMAHGCPGKLMWLKKKVLKLMGPYLSRLRPKDLDSTSDDQLCQFFNSTHFKSSFNGVKGMNPMLARRFLQRVKKCTGSQEDFLEQMERLGMLTCYYDDVPPNITPLNARLLAQLEDCHNSGGKKLRKHLVERLISSKETSSPELLRSLGTGVTMLSPEQLSMFPATALLGTLTTHGAKLKWKLNQAKKLVEELLGEKTTVSVKELMAMSSAVRGIPASMLMKVQAQEILDNEGLQNVTKRMSMSQRTALLQGLRQKLQGSELIKKLPGPLLYSLSLDDLSKANLTSLDNLEGKHWTRAQSAFLVKKLIGTQVMPKDIRKLGSALQGMTCKMMDTVAESVSKEIADAMTETPQWLSKTQVVCTARMLFATLKKERPDYFRNITEGELDAIPTLLLIHLPPAEIKDLPDSVCPTFLAKMSAAKLSFLCVASQSRPALARRALRCLANGHNISLISSEEVLDLGQLLCELPPTQLQFFNSETLNASLQAIASCLHIPPLHRLPLIRLLKRTYGNPSDWSKETMESLGPLLLLDDSEVKALHYKPWLKAVLSDLKDSLFQETASPHLGLSSLGKKLFSLSTHPGGAHIETEDNSVITEPTEELIEDLGEANVYWTPQQLNRMTVETFRATIETLGSITEFNAEQLAVLKDKAGEAFGPVAGLNESVVMQLGCVSQAFPNLNNLSISLETLEELSGCGWVQPQREAVWKDFAYRGGMTSDKLGATEIVGLNQFLCGLSSEDIRKLQMDAFRDAVESIGNIQCPVSVTKEFKKLGVAVFGEPSQWTEAEVSTLGNIVAGLEASELRSLDPSVFSFLTKQSIPLIPAEDFATLSVSQLQALGPDNSAMVTHIQRAGLGEEKLAALDEALTGSRAEQPTGPQTSAPSYSGAPSLSIEGIAAFVKPFSFLFVGFLLL